MVVLAPASILPNTPDFPVVGINLTPVNPASCASFAIYSGPCGKFRFSAAIDGSAIQSCNRLTLAACIFGIWASTAALSASLSEAAANIAAGSAANAAPDVAACTKSRLLKPGSFSTAISVSSLLKIAQLGSAQIVAVVSASIGVIRRHFQQVFALFGGQFSYCLGGRSENQAAVGKHLPFRDESAGADQAAFSDNRTIEHNGLDADQ